MSTLINAMFKDTLRFKKYAIIVFNKLFKEQIFMIKKLLVNIILIIFILITFDISMFYLDTRRYYKFPSIKSFFTYYIDYYKRPTSENIYTISTFSDLIKD